MNPLNKPFRPVLFLAALAASLPAAAPRTGWATVDEAPLDDMDILIGESELIVMGHVTAVRAGLRETVVQIQVARVFKGDGSIKALEVEHGGGKHTIEPDEPAFTSFDKAILYLKRRPDGRYRCVNGAAGKKTIYNDNIYLHPNNNFVTAKLKKYEELLTKKLLALNALTPPQPPVL